MTKKKINKCDAIPSEVIPPKALKKIQKKPLGERHVIMQNRARRCMEEKKIKWH